jgi:tetratricopeptide (TPR) repeat protein
MGGTTRDNRGQTARGGGDGGGRRLRSWKEIAAHFGTTERTVKRWEATRGLPVQRVPGGARTAVFADTSALDQWISGKPDAPAGTGTEPPGRARLFAGIGLAVVLTIGAGVIGYSQMEVGGAQPAKHQPTQRAVDLYTAAVYQAERATPDSMRRAISLFGQAITDDPAYAEAYAGLAQAYLRLRVFAAVTEAEAYPRAKSAAQRALELDPNLSQAHAAMGYVSFYSDWDFARGLHHFAEATRLDPRSAAGRYQYGIALLHSGDPSAALRELEAAQRLDPRSRSILADKGIILYLIGRREEGTALIRQVVANDPDYVMAHQYLSLIHLGEGEWRAGLAQAETVARMRQDSGRLALAEPARRALDEGGGEAMLRSVLAGHRRLHAAGREPAYVLAEFHALLGEREPALRYLRQSIAAREPLALMIRFDPLLRRLHGDPEFQRLAVQIGLPRSNRPQASPRAT